MEIVFMNRFGFALAMGITALTMLSGCESTEKNSSPAQTETKPAAPIGSHTMPDGKKMDNQDMKK